MKEPDFKYDVVLSFAEEQRSFVDGVAGYLKGYGIRYFYDDDKRVETWGKNLYAHLDEVYRKEAKYCVLFISADYKTKRWTQHEKDRALARAFFTENREYILPFRFDDTRIDGLSDMIAYLTRVAYDEQKLAAAIVQKIRGTEDENTVHTGVHVEKARKKFPWRDTAIFGLLEKETSDLSVFQKIKRFFSKRTRVFVVVFMAVGVFFFEFADELTPANALTERIHERSKATHGTICRDGTPSFSHGRGACSHHGGVDHYIDTIAYRKTMDQCREEAEKISWFP